VLTGDLNAIWMIAPMDMARAHATAHEERDIIESYDLGVTRELHRQAR
jgi:hypothetical protein